MSCATTFKLVYPKKSDKGKTFWKEITSPKSFIIEFNARSTSYKAFQEKVAVESNI
jgi:hypothetical protein